MDIWTREGLPNLEFEMPHIPGSDMAGEVVGVGEDVSRFSPGDRVALSAATWCGDCEFCRNGERPLCINLEIIGEDGRGVHAEYAAVPEDNLVPVPADVSWEVAGCVSLVFQTAWRMIVNRAEVKPGETVLVLGASGGIGHAAVQIAKHAGATVFATASTEEKRSYALDLGATYAIDYTEDNFADRVRELTNGRGVDVVVDHVAGETWSRSLESLAKGGRLVTCGATDGFSPSTFVPRVFGNQLSILGSTVAEPGAVEKVLSLVWDGTFEPRIREVLPMSEAQRGHELLEDRQGFGKVVLIPDRLY